MEKPRRPTARARARRRLAPSGHFFFGSAEALLQGRRSWTSGLLSLPKTPSALVLQPLRSLPAEQPWPLRTLLYAINWLCCAVRETPKAPQARPDLLVLAVAGMVGLEVRLAHHPARRPRGPLSRSWRPSHFRKHRVFGQKRGSQVIDKSLRTQKQVTAMWRLTHSATHFPV